MDQAGMTRRSNQLSTGEFAILPVSSATQGLRGSIYCLKNDYGLSAALVGT